MATADFAGRIVLPTPSPSLLDALGSRVEDGLFQPGNRTRADYHVVERDAHSLRFVAGDALTAFNVGFNDCTVRCADGLTVDFEVSYARWARYSVRLGALIFVAGAAVFPFIRGDVESYGTIGRAVFWGNMAFWGLVWPQLLIRMHARHAKAAFAALIRTVAGVG